jgi:hypothetical protein
MAGIRSRGMGGGAWEKHEDVVLDKPFTLLCHQGNVQLEVDDAIKIDYDMTRYHGQRVVKIDPVAKAWIEFILGYQLERDLQPQDRPDSMAHVIGLVDLPIKLMQKEKHGLPFFIKEPETSLHPSQQSRIANFLQCIAIKTDNETGAFTEYPEGYHDGWSAENS